LPLGVTHRQLDAAVWEATEKGPLRTSDETRRVQRPGRSRVQDAPVLLHDSLELRAARWRSSIGTVMHDETDTLLAGFLLLDQGYHLILMELVE
jgi:hypothetical protein